MKGRNSGRRKALAAVVRNRYLRRVALQKRNGDHPAWGRWERHAARNQPLMGSLTREVRHGHQGGWTIARVKRYLATGLVYQD